MEFGKDIKRDKSRAKKELIDIGNWISKKTSEKKHPRDELESLSISLMYLKKYIEESKDE
jgi:hypothetical protein